jgi:hypothetical protein
MSLFLTRLKSSAELKSDASETSPSPSEVDLMTAGVDGMDGVGCMGSQSAQGESSALANLKPAMEPHGVA